MSLLKYGGAAVLVLALLAGANYAVQNGFSFSTLTGDNNDECGPQPVQIDGQTFSSEEEMAEQTDYTQYQVENLDVYVDGGTLMVDIPCEFAANETG